MRIITKLLISLKNPPSLGLIDVQNEKITEAIKRIGPDGVMINIGSKNFLVNKNVINIDIATYKNVHCLCSAEKLSIKNQSIDAVFIIALLEILEAPEKAVKEIYRVLKPGGIVVATTPFIQSYHPDPIDTHRFTIHGAKLLFNQYDLEQIIPTRGTFGSFLCILKDYLAIFFSFNSIFLYKLFCIVITWIFWPLKYLDRLMPSFQNEEYVASSFTIVAKKSEKIR